MFERFDRDARQCVILAQEAATSHNHGEINSGHVLIGVLAQDVGIGAAVLKAHGITAETLGKALLSKKPAGNAVYSGHMPFTPDGKRSLELALRVALGMYHSYIGSEHLLLALTMDASLTSAQMLDECGLGYDIVQQSVAALLKARTPEFESQIVQGLAKLGEAGSSVSLKVGFETVQLSEQAKEVIRRAYKNALPDKDADGRVQIQAHHLLQQ